MRLFKVDLPYGLCQRGVDFCRWWNLDKRRLLFFMWKNGGDRALTVGRKLRWKVKFEFKHFPLSFHPFPESFSWYFVIQMTIAMDEELLKIHLLRTTQPVHTRLIGNCTYWVLRVSMGILCFGRVERRCWAKYRSTYFLSVCVWRLSGICLMTNADRTAGFKWKPIERVGPLGYSCVSVVKAISSQCAFSPANVFHQI